MHQQATVHRRSKLSAAPRSTLHCLQQSTCTQPVADPGFLQGGGAGRRVAEGHEGVGCKFKKKLLLKLRILVYSE